jgi:hypothetical protein
MLQIPYRICTAKKKMWANDNSRSPGCAIRPQFLDTGSRYRDYERADKLVLDKQRLHIGIFA